MGMFYVMESLGNIKKYLHIVADMRPNAQILPMKVIWNDGREFIIEQILDIKRNNIEKLGEQCMAYYCIISGKRKVIYLDSDMQWFVI